MRGIIGYLRLGIDHIFARSGTQFAPFLHIACILVMFFVHVLALQKRNVKRTDKRETVKTSLKRAKHIHCFSVLMGWLGGYTSKRIAGKQSLTLGNNML